MTRISRTASELMAGEAGVTEKLVRVDPDQTDALVEKPQAEPMVMGRGLRALAAAEALELAPGMSEEHVDRTREFIDAYNRRDFDAATRDFDPDIEWVLPDHQRSDSAIGKRGIIRFWEGLDETFDELQLRPQEYVDAGDRVATRLRHHVRGKGSGLEMENELYHQVTTFRDGTIVRIEYVTTWEEALEAAGVR